MKKLLINLTLFQFGWLVCVLGGDIYALIFTLIALMIHHGFVLHSRREWKLIAIVVASGCLWDFVMVKTGVISFPEASPIGLPLWLVCLWILFATTFMHGLLWLHRHLAWATFLAAVLGPASYWFGSNLAAAELRLPLMSSLLIIAVGWAMLFPCGIYYAGQLKAKLVP